VRHGSGFRASARVPCLQRRTERKGQVTRRANVNVFVLDRGWDCAEVAVDACAAGMSPIYRVEYSRPGLLAPVEDRVSQAPRRSAPKSAPIRGTPRTGMSVRLLRSCALPRRMAASIKLTDGRGHIPLSATTERLPARGLSKTASAQPHPPHAPPPQRRWTPDMAGRHCGLTSVENSGVRAYPN
jgi:hypothetical protein